MIIQADGHAGGWTLGESEPKEKRGGILDKRRGNKAKQKKKYETEYGTNGRSRAHDDDRVTRFSNPLPNPTLQSAGDKNLLNRSTDRLKLKDDRLGGTRIVE